MMFQKTPSRAAMENVANEAAASEQMKSNDEVETVVGPSVNVEGDFASEGNIVVKGSVAGSVRTSRHLSVEQSAKIMANVRAGSAQIAGEVRGNIKIKETLELTSTARVMGDIEVKVLVVEAGALISGKVLMPGLDGGEAKGARANKTMIMKKNEELEPTVV